MTATTPLQFLYLTSKSLQLINSENTSTLDFESDVFSDREIINQDKFESNVVDFLKQQGSGAGNIILLLSSELVFQKSIVLDDTEEAQKEFQNFLEALPVKAEQLVKLKNYEEKNLNVYATDKKLYLSFKKICDKLGWKIESVIPASKVVGLSSKESLSWEEVKQVIENPDLFKKVNFLAQTEGYSNLSKAPKPRDNKKTSGKGKYIWGFLFMLIIGGAVAGYVLGYVKLPNFNSSPKVENKVAAIITPIISTPSATLTPAPSTSSAVVNLIPKNKLKVKILNGSGITGQASKLKDQLLDLGFKNITTGNASKSADTKSMVQFTASVSAEIRKEVVDELNKTLTDVLSKVVDIQTVDILITTR